MHDTSHANISFFISRIVAHHLEGAIHCDIGDKRHGRIKRENQQNHAFLRFLMSAFLKRIYMKNFGQNQTWLTFSFFFFAKFWASLNQNTIELGQVHGSNTFDPEALWGSLNVSLHSNRDNSSFSEDIDNHVIKTA